ncbi:MAG: DUF309 domain-containing protein [Thermoanaerobaculia bacterium]
MPSREAIIERGLREFREGRFFEAHEVWEELWMVSTGPERLSLQGLIQLAAALVHLGRGRVDPARRLLALALAKFQDTPDGFAGLSFSLLRRDIAAAADRLAEGREIPPAAGLIDLYPA